MNRHKNFVFYFPYRGVGGIPVLFLRVAKILKSNFSINCYVVDYKDGYMARNLPAGIVLLPWSENSQTVIPENSCLIFQSDLPWGIPLNLKVPQKTTMYFWTCYPFNFIPVLPGKLKIWMSETAFKTKLLLNTFLFPAKLKTVKFIRLLSSKKALCFMDGANMETTEDYLGVKIDSPVFMPIIIHPSIKKGPAPLNDNLHFCWIGRLGDFKTFILKRTLEDLASYALEKQEKLQFTIIGSDPVFNVGSLLSFQNNFFSIEHIDHMPISQIDDFLINKIHLLFAMGTSALEGAKLAIPTILLNFSYGDVSSDYRYNFIQNSTLFKLGELITSKNLRSGMTISEIVHSLKSNYGGLSEKAFNYFTGNHSSEIWIQNFVEQAEKSELEYTSLAGSSLLKKPFYFIFWKFIKKLL